MSSAKKRTTALKTGENQPPQEQFLLYTTEEGNKRIEVRLEKETVWLTQAGMAELFQTTVANINIHLKNSFAEGELSEAATIKDYLIVRSEGVCRVTLTVKHYSLEAIIAVGYRVKSLRGTQFRQWATERLSEYIIKGFVMDDERLKNPPVAGSTVPDYCLTSWKSGEVHKADVTIAKNYLAEHEIDELNRIVVIWLDYAEDQARRRKQVFMKDWELKLEEFLIFNDRKVLPNASSVCEKNAEVHARDEYDRFAQRRREYKESLGEEESIKAREDAAKLVGRRQKNVEGRE